MEGVTIHFLQHILQFRLLIGEIEGALVSVLHIFGDVADGLHVGWLVLLAIGSAVFDSGDNAGETDCSVGLVDCCDILLSLWVAQV